MDLPLWRRTLPFIVIGMADVFAIGFGMGVPIFAILLGFPAGWYLARRDSAHGVADRDALKRALSWSGVLAGATLAVLAVIWGSQVSLVFDQGVSATDWGIPLILYTSQASKIGWFVLMVLVSPVLQFMAVLTGAVAGFVVRGRGSGASAPEARATLKTPAA